MLGLVGWLLARRRTASARQCFLAGLVVLAPLPIILWTNQELKLAAGWPDPFVGNRVALVLVAILFPGTPRAVLLAVSAIALTGVVHLQLWHAQGVDLPRVDEPWVLAFHWVVACVIVVMRGLLERVQRQYSRTRAALAALAQLSIATRALRDGANTPLQTIETVAYLQRSLDPRLEEASGRLQRSSNQLRRMLGSLIRYEALVEWEEDDLSFRAEKRLEALHDSLMRDANHSIWGRR